MGTIAIQKHDHKCSGSNWIPEGRRPSGSSHSAEARGRIEYTTLEVTNTLSGIERVLRHLSLLPFSVIKVCRKLVQSRQACCCCSVLLGSCCVHKKKNILSLVSLTTLSYNMRCNYTVGFKLWDITKMITHSLQSVCHISLCFPFLSPHHAP